MKINSRPSYGEKIGRVTKDGDVVLHDIFEKFIDDLVNSSNQNTASARSLEANLSAVLTQLLNKPNVVSTGVAYECGGQEDVVVATAGVVIKLPASPRRNKNLKVVKATTADVTVDGNGKITVGDTTILFNSDIYSTLNLTYVVDLDEWFIT